MSSYDDVQNRKTAKQQNRKTAKPQTPTIQNVGHHSPCDPYKIDSGDRPVIGTTYTYLRINEILKSSISRLASFKACLSPSIHPLPSSLGAFGIVSNNTTQLSIFGSFLLCIGASALCRQLLNGPHGLGLSMPRCIA